MKNFPIWLYLFRIELKDALLYKFEGFVFQISQGVSIYAPKASLLEELQFRFSVKICVFICFSEIKSRKMRDFKRNFFLHFI